MPVKPYVLWEQVDKRSPEECWPWRPPVRKDGYGRYRGKLAHRAVYEDVNGPLRPGEMLDHICHNRRCVNPLHLRPVTNKQNMENLSGAQSNSKTGVLGVTWVAHASLFRVRVQHNYQHHDGGYFKTLEDAEKAAKALRNRLFTHNDLDREPTMLKPNDLIAYPGGGNAYLGRLKQPIEFAGERRWSVEWLDGFTDKATTYPEANLLKVIPDREMRAESNFRKVVPG